VESFCIISSLVARAFENNYYYISNCKPITCSQITCSLLLLQFSTEDLVKEVENSIAEFKRQKQDYDEERVKGQVSICHPSLQLP
jgi:hypothetical protein